MSIEIANIKKSFGHTQVLNNISLDIPSGQMVTLLGPSSSRKTTLLHIITRLEHQTSRHIHFHSTNMSHLHTHNHKVSFMFQHYTLFHHMTVFNNITFGLTVLPRHKHPNTAAIKAKVIKLLEMVQLAHLADHYPAQLSSRQKQHVALARALAMEPQILLLDEPFGALDAQVHKELHHWLHQLHEELKFTSMFMTHNQEEATKVANHVVVMSQGNIEQADAPDQVWHEPATHFVLKFMGKVNHLQGTIHSRQFHVGTHHWPLGYTPAYQGPVDLFLHPWEVDISHHTSLNSPLPVQVLEASPKGHYTQLVVQPLGWYNKPLTVMMHGNNAPQHGKHLFIGLQHAQLYNSNKHIKTQDEELALTQST